MTWIAFILTYVLVFARVASQEELCQGNDGFYPHPVDCNKYIRCVNGEFTEYQCAPETFWSTTTFVCSWKGDVTDCDSTGRRLRQSAYRSSDLGKTENKINKPKQQSTTDKPDQDTTRVQSTPTSIPDATTVAKPRLTHVRVPNSHKRRRPAPSTTESPAAFVASGQSSTTMKSEVSKMTSRKVDDTTTDDKVQTVTVRINPAVTQMAVDMVRQNDDDQATNVTQTSTQNDTSVDPVPAKFAARNLFSDFKCPKLFGFFRDQYNCRAYYHCLNGLPYKRHCPFNQFYNAKTFNCGPKSTANGCLYFGSPGTDMEFHKPVTEAVSRFRCPKDNGYYPDLEDCAYYYECILGHAYKRRCMVGTLYDRIRHKCTWQNLVRDCAKLSVSTDPTTQVTSEVDRSYQCPSPDGYFRSRDDCRIYYHCIDNTALVHRCTRGSFFDIHLGQCTWFSRVYDCDENGKPVSMDGLQQKEKIFSKSPDKNGDVISYRSFKCPEEEGYFRDLEDCSVYYFCTKWKVFQQQCKPGTVWSMEKLTCTWPHLVDGCNTTRTRVTSPFQQMTTLSPHHVASRDRTISTQTILLPDTDTTTTTTDAATAAATTDQNVIQQEDQDAISQDNKNVIKQRDQDYDYDADNTLPDINSITEAASISFKCPPVFDGYYGDPISCTKFYRCIGGKMYSFSCPTGTFFDNTRYLCNFASEVSDCTHDGIRKNMQNMVQYHREFACSIAICARLMI